MAKKYLLTRQADALKQMLPSLNALLSSIEIVRDNPNDRLSDTFARTIMLDRGRANHDPEWRKGKMPYMPNHSVEYKRGGNNDMSRGLVIGAIWGNKALNALSPSEYQQVQARYGDMRLRLIQALLGLRDQHKRLFLNKCRVHYVHELRKWKRTLNLNLAIYSFIVHRPEHRHLLDWNDDIKSCFSAIKAYREKTGFNFLNHGGVISDWSGNHLGIWSLYMNYQLFVEMAGFNSEEAALYRDYLENADEHMLTHRMGLFKLMSGALRQQPNHAYWVDQAKWRLREIPIKRGEFDIDWRINPRFCVSPYPELLWKYKRAEAADRVQSLRVYPLFESIASNYYWKDNPFNQYKGPARKGLSGIDYLIAYWFGRYHGVIKAEE